jgi:hypothetical protein
VESQETENKKEQKWTVLRRRKMITKNENEV